MKFQKALLTVAAMLCGLAPRAAASTAITVAEYRQQLADLEQKLERLEAHPEEAAPVVASLPDSVTVNTGTAEVTVSYEQLKDSLVSFAAAEAKKRPELLPPIQRYVRALEREATVYEQTDADRDAAEGKVKQILARREFRKVHGPDAKDRLMARIYYWLSRLLDKMAGPGKGTYNVIQILVWVLIGGVVLALVIWTAMRLMRPDEGFGREIIPFAPSARSWRSWLAEARESAAQQDWRNAIHLAYWAGISFLESGGAWKPNRARTPREYLRLLSSRNPNHPALSALTRKFEVVWYGHRDAEEADFKETLGQLERLGCR